MSRLDFVARFPDHCDVGVVREGEEVPCAKPAIGVIEPAEWELEEFGPDLSPYAVCVHHARKDRMVPLRQLLEYQPKEK